MLEYIKNLDTNAFILLGVAFLLGLILMFVIKPKSKNVAKNAYEDSSELQKKLDEANKKIKEFSNNASGGDGILKTNLANAEKRIIELETIISSKGSDGSSSGLLESQLSEARLKISDLEKACANSEAIKEELSKTKSRIKKLEDEIDDNEDEIDSLKKKINTKTQEKEEVEEQLYSAKKSLQAEEEKNKDLEKKNKAAESEIQVMKESNDFVSTLLKADKENSEDTKSIEKSISELEIFIKSDLKKFYDDHFDVSSDYGKFLIGERSAKTWDAVDTWVAQSKKTWLANKKIISFIGEFSAGKTTIVNTILRQGDPNVPQLPTNSKATTAIPTYISGGKLTKYIFVSPDDTRKKIDEQKFENVTKEALSKFEGINKLIKYFVMEYDNHNLQNLTILDTPGFQSNDPEDEQRTLGVVNESDALFWVVDVNKGELNAKSLKILAKFNKPLYFVLNQCDTVSPAEAQKTMDQVRKTATAANLKFTDIIQFGKDYPLDNILGPINQLKRSNVNNYLNELVQMVKNDESFYKDAEAKFKSNLKDCDDCIDSCTATLNNNIRSLKQNAAEAKSVPHWETHIFSKDRYEMSSDEFKNLSSYLARCVGCCDKIKKNFEGQMENVANRTNVHAEYMENKQLCKEFMDLSKRLQKLAEVYYSVIYSQKK